MVHKTVEIHDREYAKPYYVTVWKCKECGKEYLLGSSSGCTANNNNRHRFGDPVYENVRS